MKVLVTGANGLLGQKLVLQLQKTEGVELVATGRGANRNPQGSYIYREMDITNPESIKKTFTENSPDVVIHTAAMTQVDDCEMQKEECWLHNVTAVDFLLSAAEEINTFFIHLSTDFVFDGENGPYKEDDTPNPLSHYAHGKLASEQLVRKSKVRAATVRTILVYGIAHDMSRSNIILWAKKNLEEGKKIRVVNDQWRMPTLAEDLATGCILLAQKQIEGIFHLSGKDMLTPYEMANHTAEFFNLNKSLIEEVNENVFTQPAKRPARTGFVLDKAINLLGYSPVSFKEGIRVLADQLKGSKSLF